MISSPKINHAKKAEVYTFHNYAEEYGQINNQDQFFEVFFLFQWQDFEVPQQTAMISTKNYKKLKQMLLKMQEATNERAHKEEYTMLSLNLKTKKIANLQQNTWKIFVFVMFLPTL